MNIQLSVAKLMESQPGILVAFDLNFQIFYVNRCVEGLSREQVIGASALDFVSAEDRPVFQKIYDEVVTTHKTVCYEMTGYGPFGSESHYSTHSGPIFQDGVLVGIAISSLDITRQKEREKELAQKFEHLVASTQGMFWEVDSKTFQTTYVSQQAKELLGYSAREWLSSPGIWIDSLHPEDRESALKFFQENRDIQRQGQFEYRIKNKNGKYRWVRDMATSVVEKGEVTLFRGLMIDITKSKRNEQLLKMNAEVLDHLVQSKRLDEILPMIIKFLEDTFPDVIGSVHLYNETEGKLIYCASRSLSEFYTSAVREVVIEPNLGTCGSAVISGRREITGDIMLDDRWKDFRSLLSQEGLRACWSEPIRGSNGKILGTFAVYRRFPGVPDDEELEVVGSVRNLAALAIERKIEADRLENARLRTINSAKLSALGEMAAGMAHEVNNPLAVILGKIDRISANLDSGIVKSDRLKEDLRVMEETATRIAKIVRAMRFLGRDSSNEDLSPFLLRNIIEEVLQVTSEMFRVKGLELRLRLDELEQVSVLCRPSEIAQVIWNLLKNSYDSLLESEGQWVEIQAERNEKIARIRIKDGGCKINPDIQEKMMNPFFTTKRVGNGMGLGLSISRNIAENHGGSLYYDPHAPNNSFVFELPLNRR